MSLYNGEASVVCLSVRLSVNFCANRFFSQANGQIATKLSQDGLQVSVHPGCAQGQGQGQRSRDTRTFLDSWNELLRHWWSGWVSAQQKLTNKVNEQTSNKHGGLQYLLADAGLIRGFYNVIKQPQDISLVPAPIRPIVWARVMQYLWHPLMRPHQLLIF